MATDVNTLFQTHTIEGIKNVESQIRNDIEKKKQELRLLVGERYRDLINAADTIQAMEKASNEVFSGINKVSDLCSAFSPTIDVEAAAKSKQNSGEVSDQAFYSLATQMDLLVDTPEKVWSALDKHLYLQASQLYLLSQHVVENTLHINTGHSSRSGTTRDVYASFPIVHHQWAAISHFKPSILKGARSSLKDSTLPDKALAESLCCIALLDNFSPRQVFTEFLNARRAAIQDVFQPNLYSTSVKKQVCDITHLIKLTMEQILTMFYTDDKKENELNENPLFYNVLHLITNEKSSIFQSLFGDVDVITLSKYLPPLVSGFVPKLQSVPVPISLSFIQKHAVEWLDGCIGDVHSGVKTLLSFVNNIKGLASIRNAVYDLLKVDIISPDAEDDFDEVNQNNLPIPWSKYCDICVSRQLSIWAEFFQPLFLDRAKAILAKEFESCFKSLNDSLDGVLTNLCDPDNKIDDSCWDHDVSSFIWNEFTHDVTSLVDDKEDSGDDTLSLKVKGFTPAIKRLCMILNDGLNNILNDVKHYISEDTEENDGSPNKLKNAKKDMQKFFMDSSINKSVEPFDKCAGVSVVKENLYEIFNLKVVSLCSNIKVLLEDISNTLLEETSDQDPLLITAELDKATFLARLCLSIPNMCYHIHKIVDYDAESNKAQIKRTPSRQLNRKTAKPSRKLELLQNEFSKQSEFGFMLWQRWMCQLCHQSVLITLNSKDDFYLFSMTNWEDICIEEESELGDTVKSTIRVPAQLSFYLSSLLYRLAEEFHRMGGNLMDKEHINAMALSIGSSIFSSHQEFISKSQQTLFQNQAFQLMYDVKFIMKIFGGNFDPKDKKLVDFHNHGNSLISLLEQNVDPFDLDVVVPHINTFVQKQIQTTALLYGSISNIDKHAFQGNKRNVDLSEQHSIVQLVTHPPRFMLLPLTGHSKVSQDYFQAPTDLYDYDCSPLFLHQLQSTIAGLV